LTGTHSFALSVTFRQLPEGDRQKNRTPTPSSGCKPVARLRTVRVGGHRL